MATLYKVPTENNLQYTLDVKYTAGDTSLTLNTDVSTVVQAPGVCVVDRIDSSGNKTASKRTYYSFTGVSGAQLTGLAVVDGTDQDHQVGAIVEFVPDVDTFQSYYDVITQEHNTDGTHSNITATTVTTTGNIDSAGTIKTDTIAEHTADAGVTIDGVKLKDGGITLATGVTSDAILDEDDMSSDSATALATQQSIKAYIKAYVDTYTKYAYYFTTTTTTHDYSSLGSDQQSINDGTNDFKVSLTLSATSDVLIEMTCNFNNNNQYGATAYLFVDGSAVINFGNIFRHDDADGGSYTAAVRYIVTGLSSGTHTFEIKVAASGSTSTIVTYRTRSLTAKIVQTY